MSIAMSAERETGVHVEPAADDEVMRTLDESAQEWLGITGDEFLRKLRGGEYGGADTPALHRLVAIAELLG